MSTEAKTASTARAAMNGGERLAKDPNARIVKSDENPSLSQKAAGLADDARAQAAAASVRARELAGTGQHHAKSLGRSVEAQVRANPALAVGAAFGLGVALTLLLKPKN